MTDSSALVPAPPLSVAYEHELSIDQVVARVNKVHGVMKHAMQEGHHYGTIPGTGSRPTLLKPGAELLAVMFRLDPQYSDPPNIARYDEGHITVLSTCTLWHIPTGQRWGSGQGSCSTRESKYAYRKAERVCPKCGTAAIIKGRPEYGGGWLCFAKKGGCGTKYPDQDPAITEQEAGRVENVDLADQENTVLKMANKRALIAAILNVTAASDIFTQDLEDLAREDAAPTPAPAAPPEESPAPGLLPEDPPTPPPPAATKTGRAEALTAEALMLKQKLGLSPKDFADYKRKHGGGKADLGAFTLAEIEGLVGELRWARRLAGDSRKDA